MSIDYIYTVKRFLSVFICFWLFLGVQAQEPKRIVIKYSEYGTVVKDAEGNIIDGVKTLVRGRRQQVHFVHEGINMFCDRAVFYEKDNFIEAYDNVNVQQGDTITMNSDYVEYSGISQLAIAKGNVVLKEPQSTLTTDSLYFDRIKQQAFYNTNGKVVRDTTATITSRIGRYYLNLNKYQFIDKVVLVNPDYTLNTNRLDYFTKSGKAYMFGPSTIVGDSSDIYCERGFYDTNRNVGNFQKNAKIKYDNRSLEGDSLYFDRVRNFASATNNITVTDTINNSVVKGHYAEVFRDKDSTFITKRALAITVQENDSIYVHADTLMLTGKPDHRITRGFYNVRLFKSDLAGKADSVHVDQKTGLTKMINLSRFSSTDAFATKRKPILWNLEKQMTGDTIHLISNPKTEQLDSLKVFNNAYLISRDTLGNGYDQIKGKRLIGLFRDNEIYHVDVIKNAEVINYSRNENGELIGINKTKSGSLWVEFDGQTVDEIRLVQQADGEMSPDSMFPESARKMRDFDWREDERPKSVEDLFKDDPPLNLPVIKGLEDYIPQEDFFDEDLKSRIEKAKREDESRKLSGEDEEKKPTKKKKPKKLNTKQLPSFKPQKVNTSQPILTPKKKKKE